MKRNKRKQKKELKKQLKKELGLKPKEKIRIVRLDNKNRKGKYVYIHLDKDRNRYYKYHKNIPLERYIEVYRGQARIDRSGEFKWKKRPGEKYLEKVRKSKPIDQGISVGISDKGEIENAKRIDQYSIKKAYTEMLRPLVKDEKLLNILASPENVEKYKYRIQSIITIVGEDNKKIVIEKFHVNIEDILRDLRNTGIDKGIWRKDLEILKELGYTLSAETNAKIPSLQSPKGEKENSLRIINKVEKINIKLVYTKGE